MDSIKWLERILVSATPLPTDGSYMEKVRSGAAHVVDQRPLPRLRVKSVITAPPNGAVLHCGMFEISGLAWSGEGKIATVAVSSNGGESWCPAVLEVGNRFEWTLWHLQIHLKQTGVAEFLCRATDEKGSTQPVQRGPERLDGYACNWYHHVRCVVV